MPWFLKGKFYENCSCTATCPCTWSSMVQPATNDFCRAVLAFQIAEGEIDGTAMGGVTFVLVLDTPPLMSEGNWCVGVVVNDSCTEQQMAQLGILLSGKIGGPPEMLSELISEMLDMERHPITISEQENGFHVKIGEASEYSASLAINPFTEAPAKLVGMAHPAGDELTIANVDRSSISLMGINYSGENLSGFRTDFAWAA
jgi:hypothetical protein